MNTTKQKSPEIDLNKLISPNFHKAFYDNARFLIEYGGAGSGKSYFAAQKVIARTISSNRHRFVCTRKIGATLRHSVFALLKEVISTWELTRFFDINKTDMSFVYRPNGNEILLKGLDEVDKIKSIQGITDFWHEEATELVPYDLVQMNLRIRGIQDSYPQHILTFNPISKTHWIQKQLLKGIQPRIGGYKHADRTIKVHGKPKNITVTIHRTTYLNNPFLDEGYETELMELKEKNLVHYMVYALGEWGVLENVIYSKWEEGLPPDGAVPTETIHGLDWGWANPMAMVRVDLHGLDPYLYESVYQTELTVDELCKQFPKLKVYPGQPIYADPTNPGAIEQINKFSSRPKPLDGSDPVPDGYICVPGDNRVLDGIMFCQGLNIHVDPEAENLLAEMNGYQWKTNKNGEVLHPEVPIKTNDHLMDGTRYPLFTHLRPRLEEKEEEINQDFDTLMSEAENRAYSLGSGTNYDNF
jgi:phage terminase large subunit